MPAAVPVAEPATRTRGDQDRGALAAVSRAAAFRGHLDDARRAGQTVGLVPTMGFLHEGHASLIRRSAAECGFTAVTVFVNPLQFRPGEDLATYPRDLNHDRAAAAEAGADVVFAPPVEQMFPEPPATEIRVAGLSEVLEGASRPGHFTGVATVVAKLFNLAGPCRAYFGEKDYQQLSVVRRLVADLAFPIEVVGCPTVRQADGLACSSRNVRLTGEERAAAPILWTALIRAAAAVEAGERNPEHVRRVLAEPVEAEPLAALDYAEVVDAATLGRVTPGTERARLLVAARIGDVRLIDNMEVTW